MAWLTDHHQILSLIVSTLTLLVWMFYAHLLLNNYRRQRRPKVLINQSIGRGLDSRCLICNMSEESIYVAMVVAELRTAEDEWNCEITDLAPMPNQQRIRDQTTQGPLNAGEFRDVGDFRSMINRTLKSHELPELEGDRPSEVKLRQLVVYLVCVYVSEDSPVGARRVFDLVHEGERYELKPTQVDTERLSSPKQRKKLMQWLRRYL